MARIRLLTFMTAIALILSQACAQKTSVTKATPPLPAGQDVAQAAPPQPTPDSQDSGAPLVTAPLSDEELFARKTLDECRQQNRRGHMVITAK